MAGNIEPSDDSLFDDSQPDDLDNDQLQAKLKRMTGFLEALREKIERGAMSPQEAYASYKQSEFSSLPLPVSSRQESDSEHKTSLDAALEYLDRLKVAVIGYQSSSIESNDVSNTRLERKFVTAGENPKEALLVQSENFHKSETWMLESSRGQIDSQFNKEPYREQKKFQFDARSSFGDFSKKSFNKVENMDVSQISKRHSRIDFEVSSSNKVLQISHTIKDEQPSPSFNFSEYRDDDTNHLVSSKVVQADRHQATAGLHSSVIISVDGNQVGDNYNAEDLALDKEITGQYVSDLFLKVTSQDGIEGTDKEEILGHNPKYFGFMAPVPTEIKRDSFMNIAGNLWEEMGKTNYNFTEAEKKDLIMDIKKENKLNTSNALCISGDVAKLEEVLNLFIMPMPEINNFQDSKFGYLNKSWPQAAINKEILLKAPLNMKSQAGRELLVVNNSQSAEEELERYCNSNSKFAQLLLAQTPFDSPEFFIEESIWATLEEKTRDVLMAKFESYYMFLPLHHASLIHPRKERVAEINNFDKAFIALIYFNTMTVQQLINIIEPCIKGNPLLPCIDSPLGWLGPCMVSNLFPLDNQYRPLFMNRCSHHFLTAAKFIISKLTAIKLGGWSWLKLATLEQCLEALQLGSWIKVELNSQSEKNYVKESSKRMIAFDSDNNLWVKGPQSNVSKNMNRWFLIDSHSTLGTASRSAEISQVFMKSSSDIYHRRLLVQPSNCPLCLELAIKDTEDSEDLASSYIIQFEIEMTSDEGTSINIIELNLNKTVEIPCRLYRLTKSKLKTQTLFMNWKSKIAVLLLSQNGIGNVKIKYTSKLDINYSYHQAGLVPQVAVPSAKRSQGFITVREAIERIGNQNLIDNEIEAKIKLKPGGYEVNFNS